MIIPGCKWQAIYTISPSISAWSKWITGTNPYEPGLHNTAKLARTGYGVHQMSAESQLKQEIAALQHELRPASEGTRAQSQPATRTASATATQ